MGKKKPAKKAVANRSSRRRTIPKFSRVCAPIKLRKRWRRNREKIAKKQRRKKR